MNIFEDFVFKTLFDVYGVNDIKKNIPTIYFNVK